VVINPKVKKFRQMFADKLKWEVRGKKWETERKLQNVV
jgi:hypothetical protein